MSSWGWGNAIDFCVLASALYLLLRWSREARALRLALAIVGLRVSAFMAGQLNLPITSTLLEGATIVAILALVLIFQPELRRALMRLDLAGRLRSTGSDSVTSAVSRAAWRMAVAHCGALIVFERHDAIAELVSSGVVLNAAVSEPLLTSIFQKDSPLHDGAVVIDGDTLTQASAILPLTQRTNVPDEYGTRHRAAMGLTDRSDAVAVVASEERGTVTVIAAGETRAMSTQQELFNTLTMLVHDGRATRRPRMPRFATTGLITASVGMAAALWAAVIFVPGRSVRVQTVPLELTDVPAGLSVAEQSADSVQVWLRGSDFVFETAGLQDIVVRRSLAAAHNGVNQISLSGTVVDVPFGLRVERIAPKQVSVRMTAAAER